jgi:hypothetical protein
VECFEPHSILSFFLAVDEHCTYRRVILTLIRATVSSPVLDKPATKLNLLCVAFLQVCCSSGGLRRHEVFCTLVSRRRRREVLRVHQLTASRPQIFCAALVVLDVPDTWLEGDVEVALS